MMTVEEIKEYLLYENKKPHDIELFINEIEPGESLSDWDDVPFEKILDMAWDFWAAI